MLGTIVVFIGIILFNLGCMLIYLPSMITEGMFKYFILVILISMAVFIVGEVISCWILRDRNAIKGVEKYKFRQYLSDWKLLLFVACALLITFIIFNQITIFVDNSLIIEVLYYLVLALFGIILSRQYKTDNIPIMFCILLNLILAIIYFVLFIRNPAVISRFGPERFIFALRDYVGRTNMLPLDTAVTWSMWKITRSLTIRYSKNKCRCGETE